MKNCVDEGTLQAWIDGELPADDATHVAAHLQTCDHCARLAALTETDNLLLAEGLSTEFAAPVPSERLRQSVYAALAQTQTPNVATHNSVWDAISGFFNSFRPLAYASVAAMMLLAAIVGFVYLKNHKAPAVAQQENPRTVTPPPQDSPEQAAVKQPDGGIPKPASSKSPELVAVNRPKPPKRRSATEPDATSLTWQTRQYENAIAKLGEALKTQPPMRPALQVDYEYNMAVIDNAIKTTRDAAKKNPKDPLANQFMLAAYQSKVDFMNQIADARGMEK
jgi:negative regulator of sigma E activity